MVASSLESSQAFETASDASQNDTRTFTPVLGSHLAHNLDQFEKLQVSKDDIKDKGKSDNFAKAVAMLQVLQLVLTLIARHFRELPFAQLETLTLAIAICGVGTWIAYWCKPRAVSVPIKLELRPASDDEGAVRSLEGPSRGNESGRENAVQKKHVDSGIKSRGGPSGTWNGVQVNGDQQDSTEDQIRDDTTRESKQETGYPEFGPDEKVFESFWGVLTGIREERTRGLPERVPNDSVPARSLAVGETYSLTNVLDFTSGRVW